MSVEYTPEQQLKIDAHNRRMRFVGGDEVRPRNVNDGCPLCERYWDVQTSKEMDALLKRLPKTIREFQKTSGLDVGTIARHKNPY